MKALRWTLGSTLLAVFAAFALTAAQRPYEDQQKNLLTAGATVSLAVALIILLAPLLASGVKAVIKEWKSSG